MRIIKNIVYDDFPPENKNELWLRPVSKQTREYELYVYEFILNEDNVYEKKWVPLVNNYQEEDPPIKYVEWYYGAFDTALSDEDDIITLLKNKHKSTSQMLKSDVDQNLHQYILLPNFYTLDGVYISGHSNLKDNYLHLENYYEYNDISYDLYYFQMDNTMTAKQIIYITKKENEEQRY